MLDTGPKKGAETGAVAETDTKAEMTPSPTSIVMQEAPSHAKTSAGTAPATPHPDARVAARVEELLREQIEEMGGNPASLSPQDIVANMTCALAPDSSMTYAWRGTPILHVTPEIKNGPDGESVLWRMFTRDDMADASTPFPAP